VVLPPKSTSENTAPNADTAALSAVRAWNEEDHIRDVAADRRKEPLELNGAKVVA